MRVHCLAQAPRLRRGAAVVEFAIIVPILTLLLLIVLDCCRLFYYSQVVENCARNGALYAGDPFSPAHNLYPDVTTAAKADADASMQSLMNVNATYSTDAYGNEVSVTVTYPFSTITSYPGLPSSITITKTVQTRVAPAAPNGG
jgi:hypothetical protein